MLWRCCVWYVWSGYCIILSLSLLTCLSLFLQRFFHFIRKDKLNSYKLPCPTTAPPAIAPFDTQSPSQIFRWGELAVRGRYRTESCKCRASCDRNVSLFPFRSLLYLQCVEKRTPYFKRWRQHGFWFVWWKEWVPLHGLPSERTREIHWDDDLWYVKELWLVLFGVAKNCHPVTQTTVSNSRLVAVYHKITAFSNGEGSSHCNDLNAFLNYRFLI